VRRVIVILVATVVGALAVVVVLASLLVHAPPAAVSQGRYLLEYEFAGVAELDGPRGMCTGTLVAPDVILTAGHCVCPEWPDTAFFGLDVAHPNPKAGERTFKVVRALPAVACQDSEDDDPQYTAAGNDFALVWLDGRPDPKVSEVSENLDSEDLSSVEVVGFGTTDKAERGTKAAVNLTVQSPSCSDSNGMQQGCVAGREFFAGLSSESSVLGADDDRPASPDTCLGDSGGPAFVHRPAGGSYVLVGITSAGPKGRRDAPCGHAGGGVYERLTPDVTRWALEKGGVRLTTSKAGAE
jgi:secreted trypsin-like serine protease